MKKFKVVMVESERGWGQSYEDVFFDKFEGACAFYHRHMSIIEKDYAETKQVPDYYYKPTGLFTLTDNPDGSRTWKPATVKTYTKTLQDVESDDE